MFPCSCGDKEKLALKEPLFVIMFIEQHIELQLW